MQENPVRIIACIYDAKWIQSDYRTERASSQERRTQEEEKTETTNGFVKLYRSLLDWQWHDDPATLSVYVHLLLNANFTAGQWHGETVRPGQQITSIDGICRMTGLTSRRVRTALDRLKKAGIATIRTTNKYSVISLTDWEKTQNSAERQTSRATGEGQTGVRQETGNGQTRDNNIRKERMEESKKEKKGTEDTHGKNADAGREYGSVF